VSQNSVHHKLHFIQDTRVKFIINEGSDISDVTDHDVVLLCCPLDRSVSLAHVLSHWSVLTSTVTTVLVGTMSDVRESQATTYQEALAVARQIGAVSYIETSAKISYTSTTSAFESAALATIPSLVRQPSSVISSRNSVKYNRGNSLPASARADQLNKISTLEKQQSSSLTSAKKMFSLSNGSLHSKSSTLSSNKSNSSVLSISTGKTPILGRRNARKVQEEAEKLVKIKVERLTRDKQVEEVEIEIPVSVYNNMQNNEESDFVRNSGRRKSLACKLKNLILR